MLRYPLYDDMTLLTPGDGGAASRGASQRGARFCSERCIEGCLTIALWGWWDLSTRLLLFDRSVQIVVRYLQYWYLYDDMTRVTIFCPGKVNMMYQQNDVLKEIVKNTLSKDVYDVK